MQHGKFNMIELFSIKHRFYTIFYAVKTSIWYKLFLKECGKGNIIMKPFYLSLNKMSLGNNVLIFNFARIEAVTSYEGISFTPSITLKDHVQIQQGIHLTCASKIEIGKHTAIGAFVTITDIHHPYQDIHRPIEMQPIETQSVSIGEECKIYNNAVILPGTTIGKHCTVGANSVVKGIFPDYTVIVGSPARIVKRYSFEKCAWMKTDPKGNFLSL
jgi:acetyltransferase-like isoleucine patch superfamily enzyme